MNDFISAFSDERAVIVNGLESLQSITQDKVNQEIDLLQQKLVKLNTLYTNNASSLPTYQQQRCQEQLKSLSEELAKVKKQRAPKQKFSFKSRSKVETPVAAVKSSPPLISPSTSPAAHEPRIVELVPDNGVTLSSSNTYLSTPTDLHPSNIRLLSMSNSVVNLIRSKRHATLHAKDLSNCIIIASTIDGAAHFTNLNNCIVILKCHQFRMHDSRETRIYLSCVSRPIIENSSGIVFSRYPMAIANRAGITNIDGEDWYVRELVEDFNWLRKEHSPNWRILREDIGEDIWLKVMDTMESDSPTVEEIRHLLQ